MWGKYVWNLTNVRVTLKVRKQNTCSSSVKVIMLSTLNSLCLHSLRFGGSGMSFSPWNWPWFANGALSLAMRSVGYCYQDSRTRTNPVPAPETPKAEPAQHAAIQTGAPYVPEPLAVAAAAFLLVVTVGSIVVHARALIPVAKS